ncbi:MAG TPA: hypothetical protein VIE91_01010 [Methylophilaceae bacterium]
MKNPAKKAQNGSFLLEALISIVIFATGLIALMGMTTQAVNQVGQSKYRNDASYLASELIGDMWVSSAAPNAFDLTDWKARVQSGILPGGDATVTVTGNMVDIDISWADKENVVHHYTTTAQIEKN